MLTKPLAFLWRDIVEAASYRFAFISQFGSLFLMLVSFFFLSRLLEAAFLPHLEPYGGDYFSFVLIGVALGTYTTLSLQVFNQTIRRSQMSGTMEALLSTQTSLPVIVLSSALYSFLLGTLHVVVYLVAGVVVFDARLEGANFVGAGLVLLLTILSTASIGIISASFIMVVKQGDPVTLLFNGASWLLSGVMYPVAVLPGSLQGISAFLPMTHGLEGMRLALLKGASLGELAPELGVLALFAGVLLPASLLFFRYAVYRARLDGSLAHY